MQETLLLLTSTVIVRLTLSSKYHKHPSRCTHEYGDHLSTFRIQHFLYHLYQVISVCIGVPSAFSSVHHVAMASFIELWRKIAADEAQVT